MTFIHTSNTDKAQKNFMSPTSCSVLDGYCYLQMFSHRTCPILGWGAPLLQVIQLLQIGGGGAVLLTDTDKNPSLAP